jgi:hypothetical protein
VIDIKTEMKSLDNLGTNKDKETDKDKDKQNKKSYENINETIIEKVYTIAFIPFEYLYRGFLSYFPSLGRKYER